jgi:hypothetical protein
MSTPAPRRSARLAEKQYKASYRSTLNILEWYQTRVLEETNREKRVWRVNNFLQYVISRLTGPYAVQSFIDVTQSRPDSRELWMNKCLELMRDIVEHPSKNQYHNSNLLQSCYILLNILEQMNFNALAQKSK